MHVHDICYCLQPHTPKHKKAHDTQTNGPFRQLSRWLSFFVVVVTGHPNGHRQWPLPISKEYISSFGMQFVIINLNNVLLIKMLYSASYWRSTVIINIRRSCWQKVWSCRWPTLGFSVQLVHELAAEDIGVFQVMFHMSSAKEVNKSHCSSRYRQCFFRSNLCSDTHCDASWRPSRQPIKTVTKNVHHFNGHQCVTSLTDMQITRHHMQLGSTNSTSI